MLGSVIVGSIGRELKQGKEGAREMAAMYLANKVQNIRGSADMILQNAGLTFEEIQPIAEAMERGGRKAAAGAVTDDILRKTWKKMSPRGQQLALTLSIPQDAKRLLERAI